MEKEYTDYIPNIELVRELEKQFSSDFDTFKFNARTDFETYLCALAYASTGKELFYDAKIAYHLDEKLKNNDEFMQGMLTYSLITKINKAKALMNSLDFEKTKKVDFSKEDQENDYATIAFVIYYLTTKGYKVEWDKMSHQYTPINVANGPVSFKKDKQLDAKELLENVKHDLNSSHLL